MFDYEAYQYVIRSITILNDGKGVLDEIELYINDFCKGGYKLHSIDFSNCFTKTVYVTFERLETIKGYTGLEEK